MWHWIKIVHVHVVGVVDGERGGRGVGRRMWEIWANYLLPKALKSCPKSTKLPNLVTLFETSFVDLPQLKMFFEKLIFPITNNRTEASQGVNVTLNRDCARARRRRRRCRRRGAWGKRGRGRQKNMSFSFSFLGHSRPLFRPFNQFYWIKPQIQKDLN